MFSNLDLGHGQSARGLVAQGAKSLMAVTKVSFKACHVLVEVSALTTWRNLVSRSNIRGGELHFALPAVGKSAEYFLIRF